MGNIIDSLQAGFCVVSTEIVTGYVKPNGITEQLFPVVEHATGRGKVQTFGKNRFKVYDTRRAYYADSNVGQPEFQDFVDIEVQEHDYSIPMDEEQQKLLDQTPPAVFDKQFLDIRTENSEQAMAVIKNRLEYEIATIAQDVTTYPVAHRTALATTAQWDEAAATTTATPLEQIDTNLIEPIRSSIGMKPNTLVFGQTAWAYFKSHPNVLDKIRTFDGWINTSQILSVGWFPSITQILVGDGVLDTGTGAFADAWSNKVIACYIAPQQMRGLKHPSFGYTIRPKKPAGQQGFPFADSWKSPDGKKFYSRVTDKFQVKVLMPEAGAIMTVS